jgi:hypothetical protein
MIVDETRWSYREHGHDRVLDRRRSTCLNNSAADEGTGCRIIVAILPTHICVGLHRGENCHRGGKLPMNFPHDTESSCNVVGDRIFRPHLMRR